MTGRVLLGVFLAFCDQLPQHSPEKILARIPPDPANFLTVVQQNESWGKAWFPEFLQVSWNLLKYITLRRGAAFPSVVLE